MTRSMSLASSFQGTPWPEQARILPELEAAVREADVVLLESPVACHDPDERVMLATGQIVPITTVRVGHQVMGPDGRPRTVSAVHAGITEMWDVIPLRGATYRVTSNHIWPVLRYGRFGAKASRFGKSWMEELTTNQCLIASDYDKNNTWLIKPIGGIEYLTNACHLPIDPYILGLWLGDGDSSNAALTSMDAELVLAWEEEAKSRNCRVTKYLDARNGCKSSRYTMASNEGGQSLSKDLRKLGVIHNKHIPLSYLTSTRAARLQLLAGYVDTDGHVEVERRSIEIISVSKRLADDLCQLAWGLGFACTQHVKWIKSKPYYRHHISGKLSDIPTRLPRKQSAGMDSVSNQSNRKFKVVPAGVGPYYGLTVDGDHRYLLWDHTVSHNSGKTKLGDALVRLAVAKTGLGMRDAAYIAPNNLLVQQVLNSTKGFRELHRAAAYQCHQGGACVSHKEETGGYCRSAHGGPYSPDACPYTRDLRSARGAGRLVCNQHIYMAHKLKPQLAVFDEAHTLLETIAESAGTRLWRSVHGWRRTLESISDVAEWLEDVPERDFDGDERLRLVRDVVGGQRTDHSITLGEADLRGRETEYVLATPLDLREASAAWFPRSIRRIVLMSATINARDVEQLGLSGRRVAYLKMSSSIPVESRPLIHVPVVSAVHANRGVAVAELCGALVDGILPEWPTERGLIHATYDVAAQMHALIGDHPRLMWADRANRRAAMDNWLTGRCVPNAVLVASGVHEGLDLHDDLARFQVATTTPRPSMADPGWAHIARHDPARYEWATIRALSQMYGRVCRHPADQGVTYVLDSSARRELQSPQLPSWVEQAIQFRD